MAVHRRLRRATRHGIDERLVALGAAVRIDRCFESSWELLRFGLFKGLTHEEASAKLGAWCRRQRLAAAFEALPTSYASIFQEDFRPSGRRT